MMNELKQIRDALGALLNYKQADMDGTMVLVSRQAIHEVADYIDALTAQQKQPDVNVFHGKCAKCGNEIYIKNGFTKQPDVNAEIDLDNAREVFENWLTGNGNYPHLKHKSFGGQYLNEEAAMKWDGFKAGYYARAEQKGGV